MPGDMLVKKLMVGAGALLLMVLCSALLPTLVSQKGRGAALELLRWVVGLWWGGDGVG